ncbi:2-dehydro-3-deoxyglucarate aldolase [Roseiconus nitratireducens]|uniref:2-dehydro-3-deoxyglucarate aldolase n=1 Tax=Roseiconus nitratireducens TaxID=2605748 RepID=A0A5M6D249_9BACT|nr:aldolase/citrate lyase family protein [Roseiconus nitratireducens]KAA5539739.1 2-dehydro-3-deoxyglucarate aldolase [Roseiconus nitratireducens]
MASSYENSMMQWIDKQRLKTEMLAGTFLNLGSAMTAEIAADCDFDWLLIDLEHGSGSWSDLRNLLQACRGSRSAPIVRIRSVDPDAVKFVMDSGAAGVMFPYVSSAEQASQAVASMKYPPAGRRGVAGVIRATDYGRTWKEYFQESNECSLVVVQIETPEAVAEAESIAAVDGVDVLFVGPLDLSVNLGYPGQFDHPEMVAALQRVVAACQKHGKAAGILTKAGLVQQHKDLGFRLMAYGSDSGAVIAGMQQFLNSLRGGTGTDGSKS